MFSATHAPAWMLRGVPTVLGPVFWAIRSDHRHGVRRNLRRILGSRPGVRERRDEVATFTNFARSMTEGIAALGPWRRAAKMEVHGSENFLNLDRSKGCLLVTAHTSGFELAGALLAERLGVEVVVVMRPEQSEEARKISDAVRQRGGLRIVHTVEGESTALELAGWLRRGACVALQIDRTPPGMRAVPVTMFGQPASIPLGPLLLARSTGAPLLPVFTRRTGFLSVDAHLLAPRWIDRHADRAALEAAGGELAATLERWIEAHPTEWFDWGLSG